MTKPIEHPESARRIVRQAENQMDSEDWESMRLSTK